MKSPAKKLQMPRVIYENEPLGLKGWGITLGLFAIILALIVTLLPAKKILATSEYHFEGHRPRDQIAQVYMLIDNQDIEPFDTILFGTSSVRASYENSDDLEASFKTDYGKDMSFANLSSTAQTFLEALIFADRIDFKPHQTVIFSLTPSSFARTADFSIESFHGEFHPAHHLFDLRDQLDNVPELSRYIDDQTTRMNLLMNLRSQLNNDINLSLREWAQKNIYNTYPELFRFNADGLVPGDEDIIGYTQRSKVGVLEDGFEEAHDFNMRLFRKIIEKALASGATIHFIEQARMDGEDTFDPWQAQYDQLIAELTSDYPITYTDFNDQVTLSRDDFHDITHTWTTGRAKWSAEFLEWLDTKIDGGTQR